MGGTLEYVEECVEEYVEEYTWPAYSLCTLYTHAPMHRGLFAPLMRPA